ncbi:hypothetical protein CR162_07075 [Pseudoroseomonas rhizosphaerae]|uniref:Uncharacterized protein n=1 Tax=Teichococcus rhizosphaerae TaxID=1335062 RepID=A0A2C7ADU0_9PROT|nr:hypothetical protein [Pseudoroseomonas rhizosphaerae]PHK95605.1 hypothetical protein CR162_07075 [Pseudoroseomonas rhizosphaerae]
MRRVPTFRLMALPLGLLLGALLLPGCERLGAELRTPRPRVSLPLELVPGAEDPLRSAARLSAAAFADQGAGLQGRPAETARAAARLEYLAQALASDPRYRALPPGLSLALRGAVAELRAALGLAEAALPEQAIAALAQAARALDGGGDARAALAPPLFPAGPEATLRRLREPGPLPEAAIATGRTEEAIRALDAGSGWTVTPERSLPR